MSRALVLSGGGSVGIAWQSGLVVGLAAAGVRLGDADRTIGTSAGSAVGAQIALGRDLSEQIERYRSGRTPSGASAGATAGGGAGDGGAAAASTAQRMARLMELMAGAADAPDEERRRAIGHFALEADAGPEEGFVGAFRYLRGDGWPAGYACTAVDAETGEFVVWEGQPGVELDRAVASSCAVPGVFPPITINGRRYIDGGMRSGTNADLAAGHDRVLIITLMSGARTTAMDEAWAERLRATREAELDAIRSAGGSIETIAPDDDAAAVLGINLMDGSRLLEAAEAGLRQGKREADRLRDFWTT
ncbi:MAG TPA: patatin-like phospholipase family protein [Acidimicrobiales bacterium]|nr:patatin-like phospholipase family protein [Acidimicrobiales bacterium]